LDNNGTEGGARYMLPATRRPGHGGPGSVSRDATEHRINHSPVRGQRIAGDPTLEITARGPIFALFPVIACAFADEELKAMFTKFLPNDIPGGKKSMLGRFWADFQSLRSDTVRLRVST